MYIVVLIFKHNLGEKPPQKKQKQDFNFLIILVHTAFPMHTTALSANKASHLFVITTT